jgi:hypothetical protein
LQEVYEHWHFPQLGRDVPGRQYHQGKAGDMEPDHDAEQSGTSGG